MLFAAQRPWLEAAALMRHPAWQGEGVGDGRRLPVMLVPGFLAGDPSLSLLKRWLRARNYWTCTSQISLNVDCTRLAVGRLERRLIEFTDRIGRPTAIVGQSRGRIFAKLMAIRQPERVCGIVTLGSPNVDHLTINPLIARQLRLVAALGSAGVPGVLRNDCVEGECAEELAEWLAEPFPTQVPYVSVYSLRDWVVDWRACVDPDADNVEVDSSHVGMCAHAQVYELLGERLAALAASAPSDLAATRLTATAELGSLTAARCRVLKPTHLFSLRGAPRHLRPWSVRYSPVSVAGRASTPGRATAPRPRR